MQADSKFSLKLAWNLSLILISKSGKQLCTYSEAPNYRLGRLQTVLLFPFRVNNKINVKEIILVQSVSRKRFQIECETHTIKKLEWIQFVKNDSTGFSEKS